MPSVRSSSVRLVLVALASWTLTAGASAADAQTTWSLGGSVAIAPPLGGWSNDLEAGTEYRLSISRTRVGSRWTLQAEVGVHPFDFADEAIAARDDGSARGFVRQSSLDVGLRYSLVERSSLSTWARGGVGVHSVRTSLWDAAPIPRAVFLHDEWVPAVNAGFGAALGPFRLKPVVDIGVRVVNLRGRPLVSLPIAIGLRF